MAAQKFTAAEVLDMLENVQDDDLDHYHEELEQESGELGSSEGKSLRYQQAAKKTLCCVYKEKNTNWQSEGHKKQQLLSEM